MILSEFNQSQATDLRNVNVSFLKNIRKPDKFEIIKLSDALDKVKKQYYRQNTHKLRSLSDEGARRKQKEGLAAIAFTGVFFGRVVNDCFGLSSGLLPFDVDGLLLEDIESHRSAIAAIPSVVFCFISPSGNGLKGALRIDPERVKSDADFKRIFREASLMFRQHGFELDQACKDVRRLCFVSFDPNIYINWGAAIFSADINLQAPLPETATHLSRAGNDNAYGDEEGVCINRALDIIKKSVPGNRHEARLRAGQLAGGYIAGGLVDEAKMLDLLFQISDSVSEKGITDAGERKAIMDAVENGKIAPIISPFAKAPANLFQIEANEESRSLVTQGLKFTAPVLPGTDARDGTINTRPLSELGNAWRLHDAHQSNIYYVHDAKAWLYWRDDAWCWDVDGAFVRGLATYLPEQIYNEGGVNLAEATLFAQWSRTSQKVRTIEAAVSLLEDFDQIRLPLSRVDADQYRVGFNSGRQVIELKTGVARPAKQSDFVTKTLNVKYLGDSTKARRWLDFLAQIFNDDEELIDWIKRWCGYLLTGSMSEQIFVFCFGLGANGKSVLADTVRFILGDYARAIASETLTESKRQAGGATPDLAELIGARLAMCSETEDGAALAESLVKGLVAGDTMTVRKLYCAPIQFRPQFKLMMLGNHKPVIRGNDYGIWRRVRLIPFKRIFKPEERDPALQDKLKVEAPHILAWMVEGCIDWQQRGLADVPAAIREATGSYQEEQDLIGRWIEECCKQTSSSEASTAEIYASYKEWCIENGLRPSSNVALGRHLSNRGFQNCNVGRGRGWRGLTIAGSTHSESYRTASGR